MVSVIQIVHNHFVIKRNLPGWTRISNSQHSLEFIDRRRMCRVMIVHGNRRWGMTIVEILIHANGECCRGSVPHARCLARTNGVKHWMIADPIRCCCRHVKGLWTFGRFIFQRGRFIFKQTWGTFIFKRKSGSLLAGRVFWNGFRTIESDSSAFATSGGRRLIRLDRFIRFALWYSQFFHMNHIQMFFERSLGAASGIRGEQLCVLYSLGIARSLCHKQW